MNVVSRRPERGLAWHVLNDFDRALDGIFRPRRSAPVDAERVLVPPVDVAETDSAYVVKADLPGVGKGDIEVTIKDGVLTVSAQSGTGSNADTEGRVIRRERRQGKFVRSLRLADDIDASGVLAEHKDGVLVLTLPKAEAARPRKIEVEVH